MTHSELEFLLEANVVALIEINKEIADFHVSYNEKMRKVDTTISRVALTLSAMEDYTEKEFQT